MKSILAYVSEYDISAALGLSFLAPKRERAFHDESQDSSYNTYAVQQESARKIIKV